MVRVDLRVLSALSPEKDVDNNREKSRNGGSVRGLGVAYGCLIKRFDDTSHQILHKR